MIVRDEARCLERCLASARPWVDGIVVLDTGSVDATVEIARRHGARVAHFEWIDDFAAARNAALAASDADWRLVLDADEWIAEGGESLAALRRQAADFVGQVRVASLFDAAGGGSTRRRAGCRGSCRAASLRRPHPRAARERAAAPAPAPRRRPRRLPRCAEGGQGRAQRAAARAWRSRPSPRTPIFTTSSARTSSWRPLRRGRAALSEGARALRRARGLAPRPGAAHLFTLKKLGRFEAASPGRGRDAALAGIARLLFHPRRPAARLGRRASRRAASSCCR